MSCCSLSLSLSLAQLHGDVADHGNSDAHRLADWIANEPDRQKLAAERAQARLESLNEEIRRLDAQVSGASGSEASGSGSGTGTAAQGPGAKRRLEDAEYVEKSREIVEGVRDAVKEGASTRFTSQLAPHDADHERALISAMLRKRKKAKLGDSTAAAQPAAALATTAPAASSSSSPAAAAAATSSGGESDGAAPNAADDGSDKENAGKNAAADADDKASKATEPAATTSAKGKGKAKGKAKGKGKAAKA